jgi:hypothetical protein
MNILRILCLITFVALGAVWCGAAQAPIATLSLDTGKNLVNLTAIQQAVGYDLKTGTDYKVHMSSSVMSGAKMLPVMVMRGDALKGAAWEFLGNGLIRSFNSGEIGKIGVVFIDDDASDNTGSALFRISEQEKVIADLELDCKKNCLELKSLPQAGSLKLKENAELYVSASSSAAIGVLPLPVMVMMGDVTGPDQFAFLSDGSSTVFSGNEGAYLKALFIGVEGFLPSGKGEVSVSLPPPEGVEPEG